MEFDQILSNDGSEFVRNSKKKLYDFINSDKI